MSNIVAYYRFDTLSKEQKEINKIRSLTRLDCTLYFDPCKDRFDRFISNKGQFYLSMRSPRDAKFDVHSDRMTDVALIGNIPKNKRGKRRLSTNLSSLFYTDNKRPNLAYGYQSFKDGGLYVYDGYLFVVSSINANTRIELFIIPNARHYITAYYQQFLEGKLKRDMDAIRLKSKTFYDY